MPKFGPRSSAVRKSFCRALLTLNIAHSDQCELKYWVGSLWQRQLCNVLSIATIVCQCHQPNRLSYQEWRATYVGHNLNVTLTPAEFKFASFPGSRAGEEERWPGTQCSRKRQFPLVTCILLRCTKITVNSAHMLKGHTAWLYSFWDSYGRFLSQKQYRFAGDSLHCFVRSDRCTSKEKIALVTCCSV